MKELGFARKSESFLQIRMKFGYKATYIQSFCPYRAQGATR